PLDSDSGSEARCWTALKRFRTRDFPRFADLQDRSVSYGEYTAKEKGAVLGQPAGSPPGNPRSYGPFEVDHGGSGPRFGQGNRWRGHHSVDPEYRCRSAWPPG